MKKIVSLLFILALAVPALAGDYNYVSPETVKNWIETATPAMIVDIQVEDEFKIHHIKGATATFAYPVKSESDRSKLDQAVGEAKGNTLPVVIVCPRGKGVAKRAYDHMAAQGVAADRLLILEKGMGGWPYNALVDSK
jgi:rhodanese-related sulfurtransferase